MRKRSVVYLVEGRGNVLSFKLGLSVFQMCVCVCVCVSAHVCVPKSVFVVS